MTNCSLILVALFLIGLGLEDSPLVILSLCSLVLFFVISFCLLRLCYCFLFCFSLCLCPSLYSLVGLLYSWGSFNIYILTYQKKKIFYKYKPNRALFGNSNFSFLLFVGLIWDHLWVFIGNWGHVIASHLNKWTCGMSPFYFYLYIYIYIYFATNHLCIMLKWRGVKY